MPGARPSPAYTVRKNISIVFQALHLWGHLSIFENIALALQETRMPDAEIAAKIEAVTELLDIQGIVSKYPSEISGGEQKRAALARAAVHAPKIMLLDEISTGLDTLSQRHVYECIEQLAASGVGIAFVSHEVAVPKFLQQEVLTYRDGKWHSAIRM
jgi:ABC-type polar amino acid transport system ATPase subunit